MRVAQGGDGMASFAPRERDVPVDLVARAQAGDGNARTDLIRAFTPFVLRVVARVLGRYVRPEEDDEASVALLAFNEAIDRYRPERGAGFLPFCETVIRRRLVDYRRQQRAVPVEVPLSVLEEREDEGESSFGRWEVDRSVEAMRREEDARERREEIRRFTCLLAHYGIRLHDLVRASPRRRCARQRAVEVARVLAADPELTRHLRERRELPVNGLLSRVSLSRKTLERQRRYIIAVALVLLEDFPYLRAYVERV